jgi:hemerythrin
MWNSVKSTGIPEIDDQHRAIDNLITLYRKASTRAEEQQCLAALFKAVQTHFHFIENFFDVKFPLEFKQRQSEVLAWLSAKMQQQLKGEISREKLAGELRQMFLLNATLQGGKLHTLK